MLKNSCRVARVGGLRGMLPFMFSTSASRGLIQMPAVVSCISGRQACPGGRTATKKRVSKRRGMRSGVIQRAQRDSAERVSTQPSDTTSCVNQPCAGLCARRRSQARPKSPCAGNLGRANSTPASSKVSRTAATP